MGPVFVQALHCMTTLSLVRVSPKAIGHRPEGGSRAMICAAQKAVLDPKTWDQGWARLWRYPRAGTQAGTSSSPLPGSSGVTGPARHPCARVQCRHVVVGAARSCWLPARVTSLPDSRRGPSRASSAARGWPDAPRWRRRSTCFCAGQAAARACHSSEISTTGLTLVTCSLANRSPARAPWRTEVPLYPRIQYAKRLNYLCGGVGYGAYPRELG